MNHELANQLRSGTRQSHTLSENTAYMKCFLKGLVNKELFRELLGNLYFVYNALETELLRHRNHPILSVVYFSQLNRTAQIREDLAFYYGDCWREEVVLSEAGEHYVNCIREVSDTEPALLVAHSYVRYLGDLSGGQALRNIVRSALELPPGLGTRFYEFDAFSSTGEIHQFKGRYRDALNSLPVDEELANKIVAEANRVFRLNCELLHSLEPKVKEAIGEDRFVEIVNEEKRGSTEDSAKLAANKR